MKNISYFNVCKVGGVLMSVKPLGFLGNIKIAIFHHPMQA